MEEKIKQLADILKASDNTVFFGGAGVSVASGIPDFRSSDGLFNKKLSRHFSPEELVSHSFFVDYPKEFFDFYKSSLVYKNAKPNHCHKFLAYLESIGKLCDVITQNIDGLHQMAGSENVFELHGSVLRNYCTKCRTFYDVDYILGCDGVPLCKKCGGIVKPDVVLYQEPLDNSVLNRSISAISKADTLIIGGTSLIVYPAAGLINYFSGKHLILLNKSKTSADSMAELVINADISDVCRKCFSYFR